MVSGRDAGGAFVVKRLPRRLLLTVIHAYQRWISPGLPRRCKYHPTCSDYAVQAITELGAFRGSIVAGWRVLRCNPLSDGGIDDLADRRLFRAGDGGDERGASGATPRTLAGAGR
jgi:putative membrane protein insertion efficiency factor